jgi:HlyD family secretion protein
MKEGLVAPSDFDALESRVAVARANVSSSRVAVQRANQNLSYTEIRSPIDGVVVERNVDVGQTVAASLSAPQLFLIANDLAHMQIVVSVDESDIAKIRQGQDVRFTVQARPNERFRGRVEQVRLQSTTLENVVSYGVVVSVENPEGKLLPGMTARVEFMVDAAQDVLKVANAALRFQPEGQAEAGSGGRGERSGAGRPRGEARANARLWTVDGKGALVAIPVRTGIATGVMTQVEGDGVAPGTRVIAGVQRETDAPAAAANPLQPQAGGARGAGRRGGL